MDFSLAAKAAILGFIEGLTEFLPVSSTGHLILIGHYLEFKSPGHSFEVLIQLGAILAILAVYSARLISLARGFLNDSASRHFIFSILLAFLPAALIGAFAHSFIKSVLFSPLIVCISLILGGVVLMLVDQAQLEEKTEDVMQFTPLMCLKIGLFQCIAMVPGVSRSGATIVGAMLMGASKRAAAEFSFFLAMPTMMGAFSYDLYKNYTLLSLSDGAAIGIGFLVALLTAMIVVRGFLGFITRHGFTPFAWWRIVVGCFGLAAYFVYG